MASEANIAVISEVIRKVSASDPDGLVTLSDDIKNLLIAKAPQYAEYIEDYEKRLRDMHIYDNPNKSPLQIDAELALDKEAREKRALQAVTDSILNELKDLALKRKNVLDMTLSGIFYGMSKWVRDLTVLVPQIMALPSNERVTAFGNWLKLENNLFFMFMWILLAVIIIILV